MCAYAQKKLSSPRAPLFYLFSISSSCLSLFVSLCTSIYVCVRAYDGFFLAVGVWVFFFCFFLHAVGMTLAFTCSMIALSIAGIVCFALSRYVFSRSMENLFSGNTVYYAFQQAVEEGGTFFVALIRLSPILPYSVSRLACIQGILSFSSTQLLFEAHWT